MNKSEKILEAIKEFPGSSSNEIALITDLGPKRVTATLASLYQRGKVVREGVRGGAGHLPGYTYYINTKTRRNPVNRISKKTIANYTAQELLAELKKRGYMWDKMWVETKQFIEYERV